MDTNINTQIVANVNTYSYICWMNKWIKTDERLPADIKKYLVMVLRPDQMRATMEIAKRYIHKPAVNDRRLDANFLIPGLVTHWMELPTEPMDKK